MQVSSDGMKKITKAERKAHNITGKLTKKKLKMYLGKIR